MSRVVHDGPEFNGDSRRLLFVPLFTVFPITFLFVPLFSVVIDLFDFLPLIIVALFVGVFLVLVFVLPLFIFA